MVGSPLPTKFLANAVTLISDEVNRQVVFSLSNAWTQRALVHKEAGMSMEPQTLPDTKSEYMIVYEVTEAVMLSVICIEFCNRHNIYFMGEM